MLAFFFRTEKFNKILLLSHFQKKIASRRRPRTPGPRSTPPLRRFQFFYNHCCSRAAPSLQQPFFPVRSNACLPPLTKRSSAAAAASFFQGKEEPVLAFLRNSCTPALPHKRNCGSTKSQSESEGAPPHSTVTTERAASPKSGTTGTPDTATEPHSDPNSQQESDISPTPTTSTSKEGAHKYHYSQAHSTTSPGTATEPHSESHSEISNWLKRSKASTETRFTHFLLTTVSYSSFSLPLSPYLPTSSLTS